MKYELLHMKVSLPVLVESTSAFLTEMLSKNSSQTAQSSGGLDVTYYTNNHHGWSLDNSDSLHNLFLVGLCKGKGKICCNTMFNAWVGAQNLKKPADSRHRRQNLQKSLQPTAII